MVALKRYDMDSVQIAGISIIFYKNDEEVFDFYNKSNIF